MKNIYILLAALFTIINLSAQENEKESDMKKILDKLIWDDEMLNIKLDYRVDYQAAFRNGDTQEASFRGQTFKIWLVGEIVPGIRYRVRHRLNKPQSPLREGYSSATDQAWVAFDAGSKWTFTVGKQSVQFGTYEYDYNPADIYVPTMCFDDLDAYKTGVNVAYRFAGQTMNVQVINSDAPQFASEAYKNKAVAVNLLWEGNLFKDVLQTRWGYGAFQHNGKKFYNWLTVGTQLNIDRFTTELDYYIGNRDIDYGYRVEKDDLGERYVRDQSLSLNLKYNFGKWRPFIKGTWNQRFDKEYDCTAYHTAGIQAVMEYFPFGGIVKDLRFHAMYAYNTTHFARRFKPMNNVDENSVLVGMRWLFKVK